MVFRLHNLRASSLLAVVLRRATEADSFAILPAVASPFAASFVVAARPSPASAASASSAGGASSSSAKNARASSTCPRPLSRLAAAAAGGGGSGDFEDDFVDFQAAKSSAVKYKSASSADADADGTDDSSADEDEGGVVGGGAEKKKKKPVAFADESSHLSHQRDVFDSMSSFFSSDDATPPEVLPAMRYLARKIVGSMTDAADEGIGRRNSRRIARAKAAAKREGRELDRAAAEAELEKSKRELDVLDVACGTGALFPFLVEAADDAGVALNIRGVDLSPGMVEGAAVYACKTLGDYGDDEDGGRHSIKVECGDFMELVRRDEEAAAAAAAGEEGAVESKFVGKFDAVVMNACFGNFFDTDAAADAAAASLSPDGVLCVTHPLGAAFVDRLRAEDPSTVPHRLPSPDGFADLCLGRPLEPLEFAERTDDDEGDNDLPVYFAAARRRPYRALTKVLRFRGPVAEGYGRGGKKLGFPTANLPASLFSDALADVDAGVYFGWAVVEGEKGGRRAKPGRNVPHKAVVNVGYSPTFAGSENPEKIVEAHLIVDPDGSEEDEKPGDFYGETMRLSLCGYLRPERKFPSFPALVEQITNDRDDAKEALDRMPYSFFGEKDPFVIEAGDSEWVGDDGGDGAASWEFRSLRDALAEGAD